MKYGTLLLFPLIVGCTTVTDTLTGKKHIASKFSIDQRKAFLGDITSIASIAAGTYGGVGAAAGLGALGSVMQGYVGSIIPSEVVVATPGVGALGLDIAPEISTTKVVTQADVNAMFSAAKLASGK